MQRLLIRTFLFYPEGPHLGAGFRKAINFKGFPQQVHLISFFLYSGISGKRSRMTSWINEMSSRISSIGKELLGLRKP
jgi:hypothetical protein